MKANFDRTSLRGLINPLFMLTVVMPTALAIIYFGFIASDVYISEASFVVRTPDRPATSPLGLILKSTGFTSSSDEIYTTQNAVLSRDALHSLNAGGAFEKAYSRPDISIFNRFNPLGFSGSFEDLYKLFRSKVSIEREGAGSITVLTVRAYSAQDARQINEKLLEAAELTVNKLNERGRSDLIRFALREVEQSKVNAHAAARALAQYRSRANVMDPEKQAAIQLQFIAKLQDELIATQNQIRGLQEVAPRNPQIPVLQAKTDQLNKEIAAAGNDVTGNGRSLTSAAVQYQQLQLDNEVAAKQLAGALSSLDEARKEAQRKQTYVERVAQPNLPDIPLEPRRWRGVLSTLVVGIVSYMVLSMLLSGLREHQD